MEAQQISSLCMESICAFSVISAWLQRLASEIRKSTKNDCFLVSTSIIIFSNIINESSINLLHLFLEILLGKIYHLTSEFVVG